MNRENSGQTNPHQPKGECELKLVHRAKILVKKFDDAKVRVALVLNLFKVFAAALREFT